MTDAQYDEWKETLQSNVDVNKSDKLVYLLLECWEVLRDAKEEADPGTAQKAVAAQKILASVFTKQQ